MSDYMFYCKKCDDVWRSDSGDPNEKGNCPYCNTALIPLMVTSDSWHNSPESVRNAILSKHRKKYVAEISGRGDMEEEPIEPIDPIVSNVWQAEFVSEIHNAENTAPTGYEPIANNPVYMSGSSAVADSKAVDSSQFAATAQTAASEYEDFYNNRLEHRKESSSTVFPGIKSSLRVEANGDNWYDKYIPIICAGFLAASIILAIIAFYLFPPTHSKGDELSMNTSDAVYSSIVN